MIQDNLDTPFKAKLKKREVAVVKIDGDDRIIKAVISEGKISYTVDILDLEIDQKVKGSEWFVAYRKWETEK